MKKFNFRGSIILTTLIAIFLFSSSFCFSQNGADEPRVMFIKVDDISHEDYNVISEKLNSEGMLSVRYACVPAEIIMLELDASNDDSLEDNYVYVKGLIIRNTELLDVDIIAEYTEQDFIDRCKQFRGSR